MTKTGSIPVLTTTLSFFDRKEKQFMEQLIFFVLGVVAVLLIWGVVVMSRTQQKNEQLTFELKDSTVFSEREIESLRRHVDELDRIINLRIEREMESVNRYFDEVNRTIDSRTDKLSARFDNELKDTRQFLAEINKTINLNKN
jgi:flagellar biosynthesis/type III secretory pathway M-ring protein FliF/YscJ